jgi:hypothetical protein
MPVYAYNGAGWTKIRESLYYNQPRLYGQKGLALLASTKSSIYLYSDGELVDSCAAGYRSKCIHPISENSIWIGYLNNGIRYYDGESIRSTSISGETVYHIHLHSPTSGWAVAGNGIYMYR